MRYRNVVLSVYSITLLAGDHALNLRNAINVDAQTKLHKDLHWEFNHMVARAFELEKIDTAFDASQWVYIRNTITGFENDKKIIFINALKNINGKSVHMLTISKGHGELWKPDTIDIDLSIENEQAKYYRAMLICSLLMLKKEMPRLKTVGFGYASIQVMRDIKGIHTRLKGSEQHDSYLEDTIRMYPEKYLHKHQIMPGDFIFSFKHQVIQRMIKQSFKDFDLEYILGKCVMS